MEFLIKHVVWACCYRRDQVLVSRRIFWKRYPIVKKDQWEDHLKFKLHKASFTCPYQMIIVNPNEGGGGGGAGGGQILFSMVVCCLTQVVSLGQGPRVLITSRGLHVGVTILNTCQTRQWVHFDYNFPPCNCCYGPHSTFSHYWLKFCRGSIHPPT